MCVKLVGEDEGGGGSSRRWITIPPTAPPQAAPALLHICNLLHCTAIQVDVTPGLLVNMPPQCNLMPLQLSARYNRASQAAAMH